MKTIYIDADSRCHVADSGGNLRKLGTELFDGKCDSYIEGFRFVPLGESWTREDGEEFKGEMVAPWKPYEILAAYQEEYERSGALLNELMGGVTDVQHE